MLKKPIQEQQLKELLKIHYGIDVRVTKLLPGGADPNAFVYKVDANSTSYFVKLKHGYHDEINLLVIDLLHDFGIKEIIYPVYSLEKKLLTQLDDFKIIVYPFIQAPNGFTQDLTAKQWKQLGMALRNIHNIPVPMWLQQQLRKESYSTQWRDIVRAFYNRIEIDTSDDKITLDFKSFFKINIDTIVRLVDSAEKLSKTIRPEVDNYVLCHSDIHAGNVLVFSHESIYIIDWDEPMMAPKERDLMFIGGGVGNVWNKSQEIDYFYEGYGKTKIDKTILSYYRFERIVEDIALFGQDLLSHDRSDESRVEMFKHFKSMFDPNGVVEIAFGTRPNLF